MVMPSMVRLDSATLVDKTILRLPSVAGAIALSWALAGRLP